jgi:hypothetical protein
MSLLVMPDFTAIALIVSASVTLIGALYAVLLLFGVLPSVV